MFMSFIFLGVVVVCCCFLFLLILYFVDFLVVFLVIIFSIMYIKFRFLFLKAGSNLPS